MLSNFVVTQGKTDRQKITAVKCTNYCYDLLLAATTDDDIDMPYEDYNDTIKKAEKEMALLAQFEMQDSWFQSSFCSSEHDEVVPSFVPLFGTQVDGTL